MKQLQWMEKAPGVWGTEIGGPSSLNPLAFLAAKPDVEALSRMGVAAEPLSFDDIELESDTARHVLRFPLTETEKIYGFGLQILKMNHRGRTRVLRVNSDPKQDTGETHAPVPFYVTNRGYGVLVNTARIVTVHCGSTMRSDETGLEHAIDRNADLGWKATPVSSRLEIVLPGEGAEIILFAGPSMLDAVRRYNLYCGGGTLPPKWGLGFWHRVPKLYTDKEVISEAMEFRQRDYPCDVIGLEPGWHSRSYPVTYEWSQDRFPAPQFFIRQMTEEGFRVNLWEHPYVSPGSELYEQLRPLSGSYTVWGGLAPDYSLQEAQSLYKEQHDKQHLDIGVSGYKLDECDGSELTGNSWMFPAHARFPSGHDGEQMRQMYGLMFQKMTRDLFHSRDLRTYGLARASGAGASSLPYVLYSDLYDHRHFVRALCNASICGLLWTPEVRRAKDSEDWVRRMQTVCFSPLAMLNAWGDGTKPWSFPEVEHIIRHYIKLRMRLLPYLYSAFARYRFDGIPPFRSMPLEHAEGDRDSKFEQSNADILNTTDAAYGKTMNKEWDDQYMVGDSLLVAPLFAGESERDAYLPEGIWYGLETGERFEGGRVVKVKAGIERIPVFVKDGAVIPMMPPLSHVPQAGEQVPLDVYHFGTAPGRFMLYDDDGESFAYERGDYEWRTLDVRITDEGAFQGATTEPVKPYSSYGSINWHFGQIRI